MSKQKRELKHPLEWAMNNFQFKEVSTGNVAISKETGEVWVERSIDSLIRKIREGRPADITPEIPTLMAKKYKEDYDRLCYLEAAHGLNWSYRMNESSMLAVYSCTVPSGYPTFRSMVDSLMSDTQRISVEVLPPQIEDKQ